MDEYLRLLLDNPEAAIQAQTAGEQATQSKNVIALSQTHLVIYKKTTANDFVETFILGEEQVTQDISGGTKRSRASLINNGQLSGYLVAISFVFPQGGRDFSLVDARRLEDGGHVHVQ
ncbi:unnamed protein product, partial [Hapterophycus canaliculatus]